MSNQFATIKNNALGAAIGAIAIGGIAYKTHSVGKIGIGIAIIIGAFIGAHVSAAIKSGQINTSV